MRLDRTVAEDGRTQDARLVAQLLCVLRFRYDFLGLGGDCPCPRCVVRRVLARLPNAAGGVDRKRAPQHGFEVFAGYATGAEDVGDVSGDVNDGRLDADGAGAAVQDVRERRRWARCGRGWRPWG